MLKDTGVIREAVVRQQQREWFVDYVLGRKQLSRPEAADAVATNQGLSTV